MLLRLTGAGEARSVASGEFDGDGSSVDREERLDRDSIELLFLFGLVFVSGVLLEPSRFELTMLLTVCCNTVAESIRSLACSRYLGLEGAKMYGGGQEISRRRGEEREERVSER